MLKRAKFMKNHIYMLRKKRGIKQYDMARALGVSPSYLSKIETDSTRYNVGSRSDLLKPIRKL